MSIERDLRYLRVLFVMPEAVELSVSDRGWRLGMVEFLERGSNLDGVLAIDKEASDFCFGGRCHDVAQFVANSMDGAVGRWICGRCFGRVTGVGAEIVMAANAAASFGH